MALVNWYTIVNKGQGYLALFSPLAFVITYCYYYVRICGIFVANRLSSTTDITRLETFYNEKNVFQQLVGRAFPPNARAHVGAQITNGRPPSLLPKSRAFAEKLNIFTRC